LAFAFLRLRRDLLLDTRLDIVGHLTLAGRDLSCELVHALTKRGERCRKLLQIRRSGSLGRGRRHYVGSGPREDATPESRKSAHMKVGKRQTSV
jgi:hypothetical protein